MHNSKKCSTFAAESPVVPDASQTIGCCFNSTLAFKFGRKGTTFLRHTQVLRQESSEFVKFESHLRSFPQIVFWTQKIFFFLSFICIFQNFFVPLQPQRFETMNDYRFINIDQEPTEEQLAQLMREVAAEAKERFDKARSAYFAHIRQMAQAL